MKQYLGTLIVAAAVLGASVILGGAYASRQRERQAISVTGLGERNFTSDLIVWKANFSKRSTDLKEASASLRADRDRIRQYLVSKGIDPASIVFSAVDIQKEYTSNYDSYGNVQGSYFSGYRLEQSLRIESKEVNKIEQLSREVTELINQGIELVSLAPDYYYTQLATLKLEMIQDATKDAKERASKIAENAGASLGKLKNASMGVIQITAKNSAEDYSWGGSFNTSSKEKTASITIRLEYEVD